MYWFSWLLTGGFVGWLLSTCWHALTGPPNRQSCATEEPATSSQAGDRVAEATLLLALAIYSSSRLHNRSPAIRDRIRSLLSVFSQPEILFGMAVLFTALVLALAVGSDHASLWNWVIVVRSIFLGPRVQALVLGIVLGWLFETNRSRLRDLPVRTALAVLVGGEKTPWALQAGLAILIVAAGLFAVRPDVLQYVRSFKIGTVEATFDEGAPLTFRDAQLNLADFREKVALVQYADFDSKFLSPDSDRGLARSLSGDQNLRTHTGEITKLLFELYVSPVITSLICLDKAEAIATVAHDHDLLAYSAAWQRFLLNAHSGKMTGSALEFDSFLSELQRHSLAVAARAYDLTPTCMVEQTERLLGKAGRTAPIEEGEQLQVVSTRQTAVEISRHYQAALAILKKKARDQPAIIALTVFEPYLTGAVSDLIALTSGVREKEDFLLRMSDEFPLFDDLISPGIINLYYQMVDGWLNGIGPIPLDGARAAIEYASRGADLFMAESSKRIFELEAARPFERGRTKGVEKRKPQEDSVRLAKVFQIFLRNSFAINTAETDIYVQRTLLGDEVPKGHHQSWERAASRLMAMMQIKVNSPSFEIDGIAHLNLDDYTAKQLRMATVDADFLLQADLALALSAVSIDGSKRASARNCNAALFFTRDAVPRVIQTKQENDLNRAQERRLEQLVAVVAARVRSACDSNIRWD